MLNIARNIALAAFFLSGISVANAQPYPPPYPRPNATQLISNDRINAWDVFWMKNQPTPMHTHMIDQFSITLRGGLLHTKVPDRDWSKANMSKVGSVTFVKAGTTHQEEGLSDVPQHKIMIEIKPSPDHADAKGTPPGDGAVKLFENPRLIAWDLAWKPGQTIARAADSLDTVTVYLEGGTLHGAAGDAVHKAGDAVFAHGLPARSEEAVSGAPRVVVVELK